MACPCNILYIHSIQTPGLVSISSSINEVIMGVGLKGYKRVRMAARQNHPFQNLHRYFIIFLGNSRSHIIYFTLHRCAFSDLSLYIYIYTLARTKHIKLQPIKKSTRAKPCLMVVIFRMNKVIIKYNTFVFVSIKVSYIRLFVQEGIEFGIPRS